MTDAQQNLRGGELLINLSDEMVTLFKQFMGKGPERCKSYWAGQDMLVILLGGGYTVAETTLFRAGRGGAVQDSRMALQQTLASQMRESVQRLTGREVVAFLSASHQDPDLSAEIFVLKPQEADSPVSNP